MRQENYPFYELDKAISKTIEDADRKGKTKREIESFELTPEYYIEAWNNGNKTHVKDELKQLKKVSLNAFLSILIHLHMIMQKQIIQQFK
jgi:hypothetical protein